MSQSLVVQARSLSFMLMSVGNHTQTKRRKLCYEERERILKENTAFGMHHAKELRKWKNNTDVYEAINAGTKLHKLVYHGNQPLPVAVPNPVQPEVVKADCMDVLLRKQRDEHKHVIILNMCDAIQPMGEFVYENITQEQHLCLCSNLYVHLTEASKKKINFYRVHVPDDAKQNAVRARIVSMVNMEVYFFRDREYVMVQGGPRGPPVAVISAAIPDMTRYFPVAQTEDLSGLVHTKQVKWRSTDVFPYNHALIGHLLSTIEDVADRISNDHAIDVQSVEVILSAWGCGKGQHEPQTMAEMLKQHLQSKDREKFPNVTFAITGDPDTNYEIFRSVLHHERP